MKSHRQYGLLCSITESALILSDAEDSQHIMLVPPRLAQHAAAGTGCIQPGRHRGNVEQPFWPKEATGKCITGQYSVRMLMHNVIPQTQGGRVSEAISAIAGPHGSRNGGAGVERGPTSREGAAERRRKAAQVSTQVRCSVLHLSPPENEWCCHRLSGACAHCMSSCCGMRSAWGLTVQAHGSADGPAWLLDRNHSAEACRRALWGACHEVHGPYLQPASMHSRAVYQSVPVAANPF